MSDERHNQAFTYVLATKRPSEVRLHSERYVRSYECLSDTHIPHSTYIVVRRKSTYIVVRRKTAHISLNCVHTFSDVTRVGVTRGGN